MNLLRSLNKEQWTAVAAAALALLLMAGALGGRPAGAQIPTGGAPYEYERTPARFVDLPDDKFDRYWQGRSLVKPESTQRLPLPYLKAPEPREEDPAAPLFRPGPSAEAYNKGAFKAKYLTLAPAGGPPVIPEGQLPAALELQSLAKMEEPEAKMRVDRRLERERQTAFLELKTGTKYEGELLSVPGTSPVVFKDKSGARITVKLDEIKTLLESITWEEQIRRLSQAIPPGPKAAEQRLALAQKALGLGMIPEAREEARKALEIRKDYFEAGVFLVQLFMELSDFEGALGVVDQALQAGGGSADLHYGAGRILQAMGVPEGALAAYDRALEASPRHGRAKAALARTWLELGKAQEAEAAASDFIGKLLTAPETPAAAKAEAFLVRGLARLRTGDAAKALADVGEALVLDPPPAEAIVVKGAILALEGSWQAAAQEFVKAIRADQYQIDAWTNLAALCLLGGRTADAETLSLAAQQRDPASAEAVALQGLAQLMAGKKDAAATLERALALDSRNLTALMSLGQLFLVQGADDAALARFAEALRSDPLYLPAYAGAAAASLRSARGLAARADSGGEGGAEFARKAADRRVKAETLIRAIKDFDPNRAGAWTALGCAYAGMGRADEARQALRMAASLLQQAQKPLDPLIYYALGYVEYSAGAGDEEARSEAALHEFRQGEKLKDGTKDPFSLRLAAECSAAADAMEEWKVTALRVNETFEREASKSLGGQWIESDEKYGVEMGIEQAPGRGGRARFSGKQAIAAWGVTMFGRNISSAGFHALEATLYPESDGAEYGLCLFTSAQGDTRMGFVVGLDATGRLRFHPSASDPRDLDRKDMALGWQEIRAALPDPKEIRIRLTRGEKNKAQNLTVSLWDPRKGEWLAVQKDIPAPLPTNRGDWRIAVFARGPLNHEVKLGVDNIRVYERGTP